MDIIVNNPASGEEGEKFQTSSIRVWPASEDIRKYIKHPHRNIKFRATLNDSVEWPFDQFTKRRIKDGTVLTEAPQPWPEETEPSEPPKPIE
jgi:hypothetical protein